MMPAFDQSWFDKLQINMREAGPGYIGIHALKAGYNCTYFTIPVSLATTPDFFEQLHELALRQWEKPKEPKKLCARCSQDMTLWTRRYEGREFCGFCGLDK